MLLRGSRVLDFVGIGARAIFRERFCDDGGGPEIAMKRLLFAAVLISALPCFSQPTEPAPRELRAANTALQVTLSSNGSYSIDFSAARWTLDGKLESPVRALRATEGSDRIGAYREISAVWNSEGRRAEIRVYQDRPLALLNDVWLRGGPNQQPFPSFESLPQGAFQLSFRKANFGFYEFGKLGEQGPWTFFDHDRHALIVSPADHFLISVMDSSAGGSADSRIAPEIGNLPAGFSHGTLVSAGDGINTAFSTWGSALLRLGGKMRPSSHADITLARLGYWTDNFAAYYYKFDPKLGYEGTLLAVRDEFRKLKIPLGTMQLDSWFYPKSAADRWNTGGGSPPFGEYVYRADKELFPQGLAAFHQELGLPLVTHSRWVAPSSPYHQEYRMSGNVVIDPRFWKSTAEYLHRAGVITYEQDWLDQNSQTALNLHDPAKFLREMNDAMAGEGMTIQYCMPLPADYMASTLYSAVQTIRTSDDGFRRSRWGHFLYDSRLATALGLWPFSDQFYSHDLGSVIISTLSGGPVAIADAIGQTDVPNLMATIRGDGVVIKPDQPLLPVDAMYLLDAQNEQKPMVAAARTEFGSGSAVYVFAYPRGTSDTGVTVPLREFGLTQPVYAWNWVTHTGEFIPAGGSVSMEFANGWAYDVLAPVAANGLALVGDASKITTLGRERIAALADQGHLATTVEFAPNEETVELSGYAERRPIIAATSGNARLLQYDPHSRTFEIRVSPGPAHTATIEVSTEQHGGE